MILGANVNWQSVAVIVGSIVGSAAVIVRWILAVQKRQEDRRAQETRGIVLAALKTHMRKEERQRKRARKTTEAWQRQIVEQLAEVREQVVR